MKILKEGDKKNAICGACKSLQPMTYRLRNVPFNDNSNIVGNVLVGVCDTCDNVVSIPHQSTPSLQHTLNKGKDGP